MTLPSPASALAFALKNWLPLLAAALLLVQTVRIEGFGVWPLKIPGLKAKYETALEKLVEARAELKAISDAKNVQREETGRNIKDAETIRDKADGAARKIEQAPTAPNCATPPEIMGADL